MNIKDQIAELRSDARAMEAKGDADEAEFYAGCADSLERVAGALRELAQYVTDENAASQPLHERASEAFALLNS